MFSAPRRRTALAAACATVLLAAGCAGGQQTYRSPDGKREVVITADTWGVNQIWTVLVGGTRPFAAHREIGCFTDDAPESGTPTDVAWTGSDTFVIATIESDSDVSVALNADGSVRDLRQQSGSLLTPCPAS